MAGSPWAQARAIAAQAWDAAREPVPLPPASDARARFWYGVQQPLLGMRLLLRNHELLSAALIPVLVVAAICAVVAGSSLSWVDGTAWWSLGNPAFGRVVVFTALFFTTFASLAPVPPFLFARHYARMAARARDVMGLGPRTPYLKSLPQSLGETAAQTVVIAAGFAPITLLLALIPTVGPLLAFAAQLAWTMHWMVVEALDNGRSLGPDESVTSALAAEQRHPHRPWFARAVHGVEHPRARRLLGPLRMFTEVLETLVRGWGPELRLIERERPLALGFGFGVAVLLAIPGINLLFRPALVIAAAHLRGRLEAEAASTV